MCVLLKYMGMACPNSSTTRKGGRAIYVYMKRNTAIEGVYDSITPYGYGGVLFEGGSTGSPTVYA